MTYESLEEEGLSADAKNSNPKVRLLQILIVCLPFLISSYDCGDDGYDDDGGDGFEDLGEEGASAEFNDIRYEWYTRIFDGNTCSFRKK